MKRLPSSSSPECLRVLLGRLQCPKALHSACSNTRGRFRLSIQPANGENKPHGLFYGASRSHWCLVEVHRTIRSIVVPIRGFVQKMRHHEAQWRLSGHEISQLHSFLKLSISPCRAASELSILTPDASCSAVLEKNCLPESSACLLLRM